MASQSEEEDMFETDDEYDGEEEAYDEEEEEEEMGGIEPDFETDETGTDEEVEEQQQEEDEPADPGADFAAGDREFATAWSLPSSLPRVTWERVEGALNKLREADKRDLTVLVVGRPGVGVSSTCNALLGQNTCRVQAFVLPHHAQSASQADLHMRQHGELLLRVVHTDRPLRQNDVDDEYFEKIAAALEGRPVDAVLLVERMDSFRVEDIDKRLWRGLSQRLSPNILSRAVLVLTHGETTLPDGYQFSQFKEKRVSQIRQALSKVGAGDAEVAVVEHGSKCRTNGQQEKILPDSTVWMQGLFEAIVAIACRGKGTALQYKPYNPNRKRLWLIPVLLAVQFALTRFVLGPLIERDAIYGNHDSLYSDETIRRNKRQFEIAKEQQKSSRAVSRKHEAQQREGLKTTRTQQALAEYAALGGDGDISDDEN